MAFCEELLKGLNFWFLPAWPFSKSQHYLETDLLADLPRLRAHGPPDAGIQISSHFGGVAKTMEGTWGLSHLSCYKNHLISWHYFPLESPLASLRL